MHTLINQKLAISWVASYNALRSLLDLVYTVADLQGHHIKLNTFSQALKILHTEPRCQVG